MSSYRHKSGAQKRQEKKTQENEAKKASRTLFEVGAYKRDKEGDSALNKPGESSVQSIAEEEEGTDSLAALVDHDTTESRESTTDSSLNQATGSSGFDVGTLTRLSTIKELEKVVRTGHLTYPPEFPKDCDATNFQQQS